MTIKQAISFSYLMQMSLFRSTLTNLTIELHHFLVRLLARRIKMIGKVKDS